MNRPEIVQLFNDHLRGYARRTRARAGGIADYFVFYLRQIVRHRYRQVAAFTEARLLKDLRDEVHHKGNAILRQLDRDTAAGGEGIKGALAQLILAGRIIGRPVFLTYKKHFRGSRVTGRAWERYNTSVCTFAVLNGFLAAHDPEWRRVPKALSLDLATGEMAPVHAADYPQSFVTAHHMREELAAVGLLPTMWDKHTDRIIRFDFYLVFCSELYSDATYQDRFNLRRWCIEALEQRTYHCTCKTLL
jgi:hypothetical protein